MYKPSRGDVEAFEEHIRKVADSKTYGSANPKDLYEIEGGLPYSVIPYGQIFLEDVRLYQEWTPERPK